VVVEGKVPEVEGRGELAIVALSIHDSTVRSDVDRLGKGLPDAALIDDLDPWVPDAAGREAAHALGL
jgi:hypothetical protein